MVRAGVHALSRAWQPSFWDLYFSFHYFQNPWIRGWLFHCCFTPGTVLVRRMGAGCRFAPSRGPAFLSADKYLVLLFCRSVKALRMTTRISCEMSPMMKVWIVPARLHAGRHMPLHSGSIILHHNSMISAFCGVGCRVPALRVVRPSCPRPSYGASSVVPPGGSSPSTTGIAILS